MTTVRDIVRRALRKLGVLSAGQDATGDDAQDALESLQALYREFLAGGVFGGLRQAYISTAGTYTALPGQRITSFDLAQTTINLPIFGDPDLPGSSYVGWDYGFDHDCSDHQLRDGRAIVINDQLTDEIHTWIYDAQTARWVDIETLDLDDTAPLSNRYSEVLASVLAVRIAPEYDGGEAPVQVQRAAAQGMVLITHRNDTVRSTGTDVYY